MEFHHIEITKDDVDRLLANKKLYLGIIDVDCGLCEAEVEIQLILNEDDEADGYD
jgi:hypothetical protein